MNISALSFALYITRFKEVCSKSNNIREQFAFV